MKNNVNCDSSGGKRDGLEALQAKVEKSWMV